jgi:hypothetical protein
VIVRARIPSSLTEWLDENSAQTMVWGPGGYKFYDFTKFGLALNISHMVVSCIVAQYIWPFDEKIDWSKIDI